MRIRRLNLAVMKEYMVAGELCFIKPLGSKLHRLTYIPERYRKNAIHDELVQVLNTLCTRFHKDIYYFHMDDLESVMLIGEAFYHMGIQPFFIETGGYGRDDNFVMQPEIYN